MALTKPTRCPRTRSNRLTTSTGLPSITCSAESGTRMPLARASSSATRSQRMTSHSSLVGLGNLAIAICCASSSTCAFGRAPPSELPPRSSVRSSSSLASSRSRWSAALRRRGRSSRYGTPVVLLGDEGRRARAAEAQRALAQVIPHAEQVVHLAKAARRLAFRACPLALGSTDQSAPPAVRRAVGERAEDRPARRRLLRAEDEWERRVELVGRRGTEIVAVVAERLGLGTATAMRPQSPGEDVAAGDLYPDLGFALSHRPGRPAGAAGRAAAVARPSGVGRCLTRTGRGRASRCRPRRARA